VVKITQDGIIQGGNCDRAHRARAAREMGAKMYLNELLAKKRVLWNHGWCKIIKLAITPERKIYEIGGDREIGYRRFRSDVIGVLVQTKQSFRMAWLEKWLEDICSFEFGVESETPLSIITPGEKFRVGYAPPWRDDIYKKRKQRGEF